MIQQLVRLAGALDQEGLVIDQDRLAYAGAQSIPRRFRQREDPGRRVATHHFSSLLKGSDSTYKVLLRHRPVRWEQTITRRRPQRIENDLPFVGNVEALRTGDMPRDQPIGVHLLQESRRGLRSRITPPNQVVHRSADRQIFFSVYIP